MAQRRAGEIGEEVRGCTIYDMNEQTSDRDWGLGMEFGLHTICFSSFFSNKFPILCSLGENRASAPRGRVGGGKSYIPEPWSPYEY